MRLHFFGGAERLWFFREANPGCGFLPQHENRSTPAGDVKAQKHCHIKSHIIILTKALSQPYHTNMEKRSDFEWDIDKDSINQEKHGVSFVLAQHAFLDPHRVILEDLEHREDEQRFYCLGKVSGGIMTVRFTWRNRKIRIIGAGYWRKGKKIYEKQNPIHG